MEVATWPVFTEGFAEHRRQRRMVARGALVGLSRAMRRALVATVVWRRSWRWWLAIPFEVVLWGLLGGFVHRANITDGTWGDDEPFAAWLRARSLDEVHSWRREVIEGRIRAESPRRQDELERAWRQLENAMREADVETVAGLPENLDRLHARCIASVRTRRALAGNDGDPGARPSRARASEGAPPA